MQLNMEEPSMLSVEKSKKSSWDFLKADSLSLNVFENAIIASSSVVSPREMTSYDLGKKIQSMKKLEQFSKKQLNSYNLEYNKKFSVPFGSIFFAILAFPLALVFGKKDGITLGLIFGIIISVLYWAATILGQLFGIRSGYNGFWMMWGPNFFLGILGILLYMRLRKK
jgi:lipopolysaccharide export system permease protein